MKSVAVVGSGITGLTAAFRLKQAGHAVTIFEASERPGGAALIRHIRAFTISILGLLAATPVSASGLSEEIDTRADARTSTGPLLGALRPARDRCAARHAGDHPRDVGSRTEQRR